MPSVCSSKFEAFTLISALNYSSTNPNKGYTPPFFLIDGYTPP